MEGLYYIYMDKEILQKFFAGNATFEEEKRIREWLNLSATNRERFMQERKAYDLLLLAPAVQQTRYQTKWYISPWISGTVAAVTILLIISGLFWMIRQDATLQYNTIIVPPGQRINLILSDNTNLWLNANTTFSYPTRFNRKSRTVFLNGEAYFDVSPNEKVPFIVKSELGEVQVTGTSFNVDAYSATQRFETSLFEGGVDIYHNEKKIASLKPNETARLENNQLVVEAIADREKFLWRDGLIAFNHKRLEEILYSLEKYFDVEIEIATTALPQHTYSGKFRQSDGVDYALRVLQKSIHFGFERDDETGKIYIN